MHLGVSMWSYFQAWRAGRMGLTGFIEEAGRIGAEGVELLDFFYRAPDDPWNPVVPEERVHRLRAEAQDALDSAGLPCPIFSISQNFAKPDPADRRKELNKIVFGMREARLFGATVVRVFAGDVSETVGYDDARAWIVEGLTEASKLAAECGGIRLALENHGHLAGKSSQVGELIAEVRSGAGNDLLGANPDTGNFVLVDEAPDEALHAVAPLANMVHFKDFTVGDDDAPFRSLAGKRFRGAAVGEGIVPLEACLSALKGAGFAGWLSVEYEGEEAPETAVPRCLANARRLM